MSILKDKSQALMKMESEFHSSKDFWREQSFHKIFMRILCSTMKKMNGFLNSTKKAKDTSGKQGFRLGFESKKLFGKTLQQKICRKLYFQKLMKKDWDIQSGGYDIVLQKQHCLYQFMAGFSKKKYFKLAKGYYGRSKNCIRLTVPRVEKSLQKAYVGRKLRPRIMRRNWIQSINSAARDLNINYSTFTCGLNRSNILLNRKILSDLAQNQPYSFKAVVDEIKIQNQILTPKRHYTIEQMVKKNLLISAKLQDAAYLNDKPAEVKVKYLKNEESS